MVPWFDNSLHFNSALVDLIFALLSGNDIPIERFKYICFTFLKLQRIMKYAKNDGLTFYSSFDYYKML